MAASQKPYVFTASSAVFLVGKKSIRTEAIKNGDRETLSLRKTFGYSQRGNSVLELKYYSQTPLKIVSPCELGVRELHSSL